MPLTLSETLDFLASQLLLLLLCLANEEMKMKMFICLCFQSACCSCFTQTLWCSSLSRDLDTSGLSACFRKFIDGVRSDDEWQGKIDFPLQRSRLTHTRHVLLRENSLVWLLAWEIINFSFIFIHSRTDELGSPTTHEISFAHNFRHRTALASDPRWRQWRHKHTLEREWENRKDRDRENSQNSRGDHSNYFRWMMWMTIKTIEDGVWNIIQTRHDVLQSDI